MIKMLEDSNIKLSTVLSKVHGVSGTRIVDALLEGVTDPAHLASLCHGKVKAEQEDIIMSLEGNLTEHHKFMIKIIRQDIQQTEALIATLDLEIEKQLLPYATELSLLKEIPGVGEQTAGELISEIGVDMDAFATDKHISSWAGVSPGNNESAGKKKWKNHPWQQASKSNSDRVSLGSIPYKKHISKFKIQKVGRQKRQKKSHRSCRTCDPSNCLSLD